MKDATYWVKKFKNKEVSLPEYFTELDRKVREVNPDINALIEWDFDEYLAAAKDFTLNTDQPFSGMPIPLKMLGQEKAGWKTTFGSRLLAEARAERTSSFVRRLEHAGFIPAGQTNSPEFGFKNITDAEIYGPTRNPWNLAYSPGGSSGGAAAAVASGLFPLAGGSDGGGSIRIPAGFCGLIGLKPTRGVMATGSKSVRGWQGAAIDFALTVSMRDTEQLFYAMRGNDKGAPYHAPEDEWKTHNIKKPLKIAFCSASPVGSEVSQEAKLALEKTVSTLQRLGHELTEIPYPLNGRELIHSYYIMNAAETSAMFDGMERGFGRKMTLEDMELITWGIYQYGERVPVSKYINALNLWDKAAAVMEQLFTKYDLFLSPTSATTAPRVDQELQSDEIRNQLHHAAEMNEAELEQLIAETLEQSLVLTPFTQLANLTGQPGISLPMHLTKEGLPMGAQFMASKGREDLLLYIGKELEEQQLFILPEFYRE